LFSIKRNIPIEIKLTDAKIHYYPNFISYDESLVLLKSIFVELAWQQDSLIMYGKKIAIPRLQAWHGEHQLNYTYSNLTLSAEPWTPVLIALKQKVEQFSSFEFNTVLANCYRNQHDSVGWHSDDEPELGINPIIASMSFGAKRMFQLKHKVTGEKFKLPLQSGSLLMMSGTTQEFWQHALPKSRQQQAMRINLTFRKIKSQ